MKSDVRNSILGKLKSLSSSEKQVRSLGIQGHLKNLLSDEHGAWVGFKNLSDEPSLQWNEVSAKIQWAFPLILDGKLKFKKNVRIFAKSSLGFSEPQDGEPVGLQDLRGFVLPGVAFDKSGVRLGRGKGYYDQALQTFSGRKVGVCFNVSLCDQLPHEAHDVRCHQVVTEDQVYNSEGVEQWS